MLYKIIRCFFLYITAVLCFLCSCDLVPEQTSSSKPSPPASQSQPNPKKSRKVGPVPADLLAQTYTNNTGAQVAYDHQAQLEQLFKLEEQGKELYLIIGRGNKEPGPFQPLNTDGGKRIWVYGNIAPTTLEKNSVPHLFMDFGKAEHLNSIPDELFAGISFDWSVVKLIGGLASSVSQYYRLLRPQGRFFADLMVQVSLCWTTNAQKTMGCINQQRQIFTTGTGREYCLSNWETAIIYSDPTGTLNASPAEEAEMEAKRISLITNHLTSIFGIGHCVQKNIGYPVPENISDYLECTKS